MDETPAHTVPVVAPAATAAPPLPFEQRLFEASPFGLGVTTLAMLVVLFGSFAVIAAIERIPLLAPSGPALSGAAWPALVLSLLCTTALGMQRYARLAEARDRDAFARILRGGAATADRVTGRAAPGARLGTATLAGVVAGLVIAAIIRVSENAEGHPIPPLAMLWFASVTILLLVLFARGVEQARAASRSYARTLDAELRIDLLRTDALAVLGRSAARGSLIWFVVSAVAFLFFVNGDLDWLTVLLIVACAAMGVSVFFGQMMRVHRRIHAAKAHELEQIRTRIDALRATLHDDAGAASRIHGLLAYEKRIEDAAEWPFDQSTLVRIAAYILIPTVPWFGQAIAGYAVEHLAR